MIVSSFYDKLNFIKRQKHVNNYNLINIKQKYFYQNEMKELKMNNQ